MARGSHSFDTATLRRARLARGLSLSQLAAYVGCTKAQIAAYEAGRCTPEPARLVSLARELDLPSLVLMGVSIGCATLGELRAAAGLTAEQAAGSLRMSRNTYRAIEACGRFPHGRMTYINELARTLNATPSTVNKAVNRIPAVRDRRNEMTKIAEDISKLLWTPGEEAVLPPDDPRLSTLAELADHPAEQLRRLVNYHLRRGRDQILTRFNAHAHAQFAQDDHERKRAVTIVGQLSDDLDRWPNVLVRSIEWIPDALTAREWKNLSRVARSEHNLVPGLPPSDDAGDLAARILPSCPAIGGLRKRATRRPVVLRPDSGKRVRVRLTAWGAVYGRALEDFYRALYPQVQLYGVWDTPRVRTCAQAAS